MNKAVYNKLISWFTNKKWNYSWDDKRSTFSWNVIEGEGTDPLQFILHLEADHYIVYGFAPSFAVSAEAQKDTLLLLNHINSSIIFGSFEMIELTSEVRFKLPVDCLKQTPSMEIVEKSIFLPANMLIQFKKSIAGVASGHKTYQDALKLLEKG